MIFYVGLLAALGLLLQSGIAASKEDAEEALRGQSTVLSTAAGSATAEELPSAPTVVVEFFNEQPLFSTAPSDQATIEALRRLDFLRAIARYVSQFSTKAVLERLVGNIIVDLENVTQQKGSPDELKTLKDRILEQCICLANILCGKKHPSDLKHGDVPLIHTVGPLNDPETAALPLPRIFQETEKTSRRIHELWNDKTAITGTSFTVRRTSGGAEVTEEVDVVQLFRKAAGTCPSHEDELWGPIICADDQVFPVTVPSLAEKFGGSKKDVLEFCPDQVRTQFFFC